MIIKIIKNEIIRIKNKNINCIIHANKDLLEIAKIYFIVAMFLAVLERYLDILVNVLSWCR